MKICYSNICGWIKLSNTRSASFCLPTSFCHKSLNTTLTCSGYSFISGGFSQRCANQQLIKGLQTEQKTSNLSLWAERDAAGKISQTSVQYGWLLLSLSELLSRFIIAICCFALVSAAVSLLSETLSLSERCDVCNRFQFLCSICLRDV